MKKILSTFAMLGALLAIGAEQEFDETKGLTLSTEQLGKVEDELKALREKADQLAKAQEDLTKAKQELKAAQDKAESDSKAIETLTAERDSFKAKYEAKPAAIQTPAAADPEEGQESEDLKAMYAELEKMY
jgi:chromosome segregation ATPase